MIYKFLTVAPWGLVFLLKIPYSSLFTVLVGGFTRSKSVQPVTLHTNNGSREQDMRKCGNLSWSVLGGSGADNEEGQRRFPPPELSLGLRRGERGSVPWGLGSKADTSKSLHMGNLSGRGTGLLLRRTSCDLWRLITIAGLGQFRRQMCLCPHFYCQTQIQADLCDINKRQKSYCPMHSCHTSCFNSTLPSYSLWFYPLNTTTALFQVADGRGNCTPHRNPTPCTIPQDRESIFHSIFAFFTKSGRKVLVKMQHSLLHFDISEVTDGHPWRIPLLFFGQYNICLSHILLSPTHFLLLSHTISLSFSLIVFFCLFLKGLWPAWKSVYDNLLQPGSTVKRRSFEHWCKTAAEHWNS